jgi:hypothetical protein
MLTHLSCIHKKVVLHGSQTKLHFASYQENKRKADKETSEIITVMSQLAEFRIAYEVTSAILCFILVWFMAKPYRFTRESRFAGLPLAFGLLGASYLFSAIIYALPSFFPEYVLWFQLVARVFAFVFLAATYYFSKKTTKITQLWNVIFSLITVAIVTLVIAVIFMPQFDFANYRTASEYVRIFIIICLTYIIIHVLRSHMAKPDSTTLLIPLAYILLAISQYSLIIWAVDESMFAWWGALVLRWGGLAIFLFVAFVTFYGSQKKGA